MIYHPLPPPPPKKNYHNLTQFFFHYHYNFLLPVFVINHKNVSQQVNYLFSVWFIHANELHGSIDNEDLMSVYEVSVNSLNY